MVESNYQNYLNDIESKTLINPELNCKPEIIVDDAACIKTENDGLHVCTPHNETVYVQSASFCDDSNDDEMSTSSAVVQEPASFDRSHRTVKKSESLLQKAKPTVPKQKKTRKTKMPTSESKRSQSRRIKAALSNADGFE